MSFRPSLLKTSQISSYGLHSTPLYLENLDCIDYVQVRLDLAKPNVDNQVGVHIKPKSYTFTGHICIIV